ncbi:MAG: glutamine synthetase family protein [Ruminococcus sp.]|nr:glutamine synthetase family protein [Ruminococcus sp.]
MIYTQTDVLQYVRENDVKFVKLQFSDIFGFQKNISINSSELYDAFSKGFSLDAFYQRGLLNCEKNLLLIPDASTLSILPWRPHQGGVARLLCDVRTLDGNDYIANSRTILNKAVKAAKQKGITFKIKTSCEFYLFKNDDDGNPTKIPQDNAGYMDAAPMDRGENIRREICLALEQMDFSPESSSHEAGPGHNEIDFQYASPLSAADNFITFKSAVKNISDINGLYATFMPKPFDDKPGSGLHIGIKLYKDKKNIFEVYQPEEDKLQENIIAGILNRISDMALFASPTVNSYKRFGKFNVSKDISWSNNNTAELLRVPVAADKSAKLILRSPDCACNPYIVLALIIYACLEGIENDERLSAASSKQIPENVVKAAEVASDSDFIKKYMDDEITKAYSEIAKEQYFKYENAEDKAAFETENYFLTL